MKTFGGEKYRRKLKNLSHFLKSDKLMLWINIFLNFKNIITTYIKFEEFI